MECEASRSAVLPALRHQGTVSAVTAVTWCGQDDEAALMAELARIRKERAEEAQKQAAQEAAQRQEALQQEVATGNPLLNQPVDFQVCRTGFADPASHLLGIAPLCHESHGVLCDGHREPLGYFGHAPAEQRIIVNKNPMDILPFLSGPVDCTCHGQAIGSRSALNLVKKGTLVCCVDCFARCPRLMSDWSFRAAGPVLLQICAGHSLLGHGLCTGSVSQK